MSAVQPLVARDLSMSYGDRVVLSDVDLVANAGQPVGVVGENGAGKSTLLRLLAGVESADGGEVRRPDDLGFLAQDPAFGAATTVSEVLADALALLHDGVRRLEVLAHHLRDPAAADAYVPLLAWAEQCDAWDADRRAEMAATRLGLSHLDPGQRLAEMSGGERSRLALAALLTRRPACMVLDEPTNNLDDDAIAFVEDTLVSATNVVVVASHDRVFLDRVCAVVVDLDPSHFGTDGRGGARYAGGFSTYLEQKRRARRRWEQAYADQQAELDALRVAARTTARQVAHNRAPRDGDKFVYHFKGGQVAATISRRVRNTEKRIAAVEGDLVPRPPRSLRFDGTVAGERTTNGPVVVLRDVRVEGRLRLDRLDIEAGGRLLVTGPNGSGKSTLLAVLAGAQRVDAGGVDVAARRVGRLPQEVRFAHPGRSAQQLYADATKALAKSPVPLAELGLLHPRDLNRPVGVLSTGQQRRLALAIIVAGQPDLVLLDEPTNHISLALASELEEAVRTALGTVIVASHDRWLRRRWPGATLHLEPKASPSLRPRNRLATR